VRELQSTGGDRSGKVVIPIVIVYTKSAALFDKITLITDDLVERPIFRGFG
jgi:hypothetical protein